MVDKDDMGSRGRPKKENKEPEKRLSLRVPKELFDRLQEYSDKERRSVNAQITIFIEQALEKESE